MALIGPSGSGKTTLLRLLDGMLTASSGRVEALGEDLSTLSGEALRRHRSRLGLVHQDHALVPALRVSANVLAGQLGQRGFLSSTRMMLRPKRADLEHVHRLLEQVGIEDKLFARTDTLSGGQQQRVALARALFQGPEVLLADEPVASVDPARARALLQLIVDLAEERDLALVTSLHDLDLAREFFPRVVGLREGRIQFDLPGSELCQELLDRLYSLDPAGSEPA